MRLLRRLRGGRRRPRRGPAGRRRARGGRLLAGCARLQARGRRGAGRRRAGGGVHQRRRPHIGAGGDGPAAAAQVRRGGRIRQLRDVWRRPRPRQPLREPGHPQRRLPRGAERPERRRDAARAGMPRCRGRADVARVRRLRAHARPGHRRRLLSSRLPAARGPDCLGRHGARRGEAAREGSRARARRGALLRVPACRDEAGQAPGAGVPAAAPDGHRSGALPARARPGLPRPRYPRGLRRCLPRREHAVHRLHGAHERCRRLRGEGAVRHRIAPRRGRRGRDRRSRCRDRRPGRHLLPLQPAGFAAAPPRAAGCERATEEVAP